MIQKQIGTKDVLPSETYKWQWLESVVREVTTIFNIKEIRTPTFEATALFERGLGDGTDIVRKEMYTFKDKGERSITLKPEGTAPLIRAYNESLQSEAFPLKLYYLTPCFRYEKPQNGRLREHHQFGVEYLGSYSDAADTEVIMLAFYFLSKTGLKNLSISLNSMGCENCKPEYIKALKNYYEPKLNELCEDCKERFNRSPLRLLDCKNDNCRKHKLAAPKITDYLCDDCLNHFKKVESALKSQNINVKLDSGLIRGQDYYTGVVFEIVQESGGSILGGGRYNNLVKELGGKDVPAVGFGLGIERFLAKLESENLIPYLNNYPNIYVIPASEGEKEFVFNFTNLLRQKSINAETDICDRSLKANMKFANKINAKYVLVIGKEEINDGEAKLKNMETGEELDIQIWTGNQNNFCIDDLIKLIIQKGK